MAYDDVYLVPSAGGLNEPFFRGPLGNDFFPYADETDERKINLVTPPSSGTVEIVDDTWFVYTPAEGQPMPNEVTFTYRAELWTDDGWLIDWSDPATVRLLRQPAAPKVTLVEEALSQGALAVTKDKEAEETYRTGWRPGDAAQAVAFVAGDKATLVAHFKVDKPELLDWRSYPIWGDNPLMTPAQWDSKGVVLDKDDKTLTVTWKGARVGSFPQASLNVKQHWRFGPAPIPGGLFTPPLNFPAADFLSVDGTSEYNLYTLDAKPVGAQKLYHTLAAIGTKAAQEQAAELRLRITRDLLTWMALQGQQWTPQQFQQNFDALWAERRTTYKFEDAIKQGVMAAFSHREVTDAKTKATNLVVRRADDNGVMNYYGVWKVAYDSKTTEALLKNADGMCDAWARFFVDVLRAQGVDVRDARRLVFPKADLPLKRGNYWMYVKSWKAADTSEDPKMKPFIKSRNLYSIPAVRGKYPVFLNVPGHGYRWVPIRPDTEEQVKKQKGQGRGQGTSKDDPQATFLNHVLVELRVAVMDGQQPKGKTVVFDPSYGMQHDGVMRNQGEAGVKADSDVWLLAFQQTALDFVGLHLETAKSGVVRFRSATEKDSMGAAVLHLSWDTLIDNPKKR